MFKSRRQHHLFKHLALSSPATMCTRKHIGSTAKKSCSQEIEAGIAVAACVTPLSGVGINQSAKINRSRRAASSSTPAKSARRSNWPTVKPNGAG